MNFSGSEFIVGLRVGRNDGLLGMLVALVVFRVVCLVEEGLGLNLKLFLVVGLLNGRVVVGLLVGLVVGLLVDLVVDLVVVGRVVGRVICCLTVSTSCCLLLVNWVIACMLFSSSSSLSGSSSRMKRVNLLIASKTSEGTTSADLSWVARKSERVITAAQTIGEDLTLPASSFRCTAFVASSTTLS